MDSNDIPVFRARGLTKTHGSGAMAVQALRGASFEIRAGEFVVLLGPSGSGKSTSIEVNTCKITAAELSW